ncbi:MAG TPA: VOC family protein, partial [Methylomirabilota bacterium]|nr:VOC family protein [Methylomirabilota bacterium]
MPASTVRTFELHAIGEIALRVRDMDAMIGFYHTTLGLPLLRRFENDVAALKIADGVHGQIQTLTLFGPSLPPNHPAVSWRGLDQSTTTLHHFALTISPRDYERALQDFAAAGIEVNTANHRWNGWRGIYLRDPEGNIVEL